MFTNQPCSSLPWIMGSISYPIGTCNDFPCSHKKLLLDHGLLKTMEFVQIVRPFYCRTRGKLMCVCWLATAYQLRFFFFPPVWLNAYQRSYTEEHGETARESSLFFIRLEPLFGAYPVVKDTEFSFAVTSLWTILIKQIKVDDTCAKGVGFLLESEMEAVQDFWCMPSIQGIHALCLWGCTSLV